MFCSNFFLRLPACLLVLYLNASAGSAARERSCHAPREPLLANAGEPFSLNCSITKGRISWLYNNIPLRESRDISAEQNGVLKISSVKQEYAGWYTCTSWDQTGRQEADYLLIVEPEEYTEIISIGSEFMYTAVEGAQVELPCVIPGRTAPISWSRDGEVIENNNKYAISQLSGSLIIKDVKVEDFLENYQCNGDSSSFYNVTILSLNDTGEAPETALLSSFSDNDTYIIQNKTLTCVQNTDQINRYVVKWTKNLIDIDNSAISNILTVTSSGFYCCQLCKDEMCNFTFCATVIVPNVVLPSSVSLPANRGRTASILCHIFPDNDIYGMYQLTWSGLDMDDTMPLGNMSRFIYYLHPTCNMTDLLSLTCIEERFNEYSSVSGMASSNISIQSVELSDDRNLLKGSSADFTDNAAFNSIWTVLHDGGYDVINGEMILYVNRSAHKQAKLEQTVKLPPFSNTIFISGRMRQEFPEETATIAVLRQNKSVALSLPNPFQDSKAWQWVSGEVNLYDNLLNDLAEHIIGEEVTFQLLVICSVRCSVIDDLTTNRIAYFNDLHLSAQLDILLLSITVGLAVFLIIIVIIIVVLVCVICRSCLRRRKKVTLSNVREGKRKPSLDFQSELAVVLHKAVNPSSFSDVIENPCLVPSDLRNSETNPLVTSTTLQLTTSSANKSPQLDSNFKLNLDDSVSPDTAVGELVGTARLISSKTESTHDSVPNHSEATASDDSRNHSGAALRRSKSTTSEVSDQAQKEILKRKEESSRANAEQLENRVYAQPIRNQIDKCDESYSLESKPDLKKKKTLSFAVFSAGKEDTTSKSKRAYTVASPQHVPLERNAEWKPNRTSQEKSLDETVYDEPILQTKTSSTHNEINQVQNGFRNEQRDLHSSGYDYSIAVETDSTKTSKRKTEQSLEHSDSLTSEGYVDVSFATSPIDDEERSQLLSVEASSTGIYEEPMSSLRRSPPLTSDGYIAIEGSRVKGQPPLKEIQEDSILPTSDYSKAEDEYAEMKPLVFSDSNNTTEPTRRRSDSLTSEGYVDVGFLGNPKTCPKLISKLVLEATVESHVETGEEDKSRPLSAELPCNDMTTFNSKRRTSSLTSDGYASIANFRERTQLVHPLSTSIHNPAFDVPEYDYAIAGDTAALHNSGITKREGFGSSENDDFDVVQMSAITHPSSELDRQKEVTTTKSPKIPKANAYGQPRFPKITSDPVLRQSHPVTSTFQNRHTTFSGEVNLDSQKKKVMTQIDVSGTSGEQQRTESSDTDIIYDQPVINYKPRSDSLTSQGYVAVDVVKNSQGQMETQDPDYEYWTAQDCNQGVYEVTDSLEGRGGYKIITDQ